MGQEDLFFVGVDPKLFLPMHVVLMPQASMLRLEQPSPTSLAQELPGELY